MHGRGISKKILAGSLLLTVFTGIFGYQEAGIKGEKSHFAMGGSQVFAAEEEGVEMFFTPTQEEEKTLAEQSGEVLYLGVCEAGAWEENGAAAYGLAAPLVDVLRYEFGLEIEVVHGTWEENTAALQAGELDFLFGVPTRRQEEEGDEDEREPDKSGPYRSAWLYENPCVLVECTKESRAEDRASGGKDSGAENPDSGVEYDPTKSMEVLETTVAYIAGNPMSELMIPYISNLLQAHQKIDSSGIGQTRVFEPVFLPCQDEDTVFEALENGSAVFGILPEDALFSRYPDRDFSVVSTLSQYGGSAALETANEALCPMLSILNRYLDATQEGDLLRQAIRAQQQSSRQKKIQAHEEELLEKLQERGKQLQYAQVGLDAVPFFWHDESGAHGEFLDFLAFVEECTGLTFEESTLFGEEALQALEDGELLFAAGMPLARNEQEYCYSGIYQKQQLVPVVPEKDAAQFAAGQGQITGQAAVARRYWGVAQEFMPLLVGTDFDGHTVGFSDERKLYEAMRAGEVGGMLIGEESFDALLLSGEYHYAIVDGLSLEVWSGLAFLEADADIAGFFERLWQFYSLLHRRAESAAGQYRIAYAQKGPQQEKIIKIASASGAAALFFAVAFVLAVRSGRKRKTGARSKKAKNI